VILLDSWYDSYWCVVGGSTRGLEESWYRFTPAVHCRHESKINLKKAGLWPVPALLGHGLIVAYSEIDMKDILVLRRPKSSLKRRYTRV
jgi:hypothetical protein